MALESQCFLNTILTAVMLMRAWAFVGRTKTVLSILAAYVILIALNIWVFAVDVVAGDLKVLHSFLICD